MNKEILMKEFQKDYKRYWFVKLFEEKGFKRKQCRKCGKFFWTLQERDVCPDQPCSQYEFLGNPPTKRKLNYIETLNKIEQFFTESGHTSVGRYPVVCRWFPGLYFTIASVVDFQRMTNSTSVFEIPSNPLIVMQPCLRFNDIPNVGTTGRHYTNFVMIGQHSLYNGKNGYWKDRCIQLDFDLLRKVFGVPEEEIIFLESAWIGYGTFGTSLEYFVKGLELGNAVFTEFQGDLNNYKVMRKKFIDMGAGLERFCWLTQGTPTSYDAVFGEVIEKMKQKSGIEYDKDFFLRYAKISGLLNLDEIPNIEIARNTIAKQLGVSKEELIKKIGPLEALYAIADHTKALALAITDYGIPSNVGGGYNLRVIFRRALGFINEFNFPFDLKWVIEKHAKNLKEIYPEIERNLEFIFKIIDIEEKRYKQTIERSKKIIESLKDFSENKLIELYDSHGITPELLQKITGKKIEIPSDFYAKITEKHISETRKKEIDLGISGETRKLYYENEKLFDFEAKVLKIIDNQVVLDKTAFYPRGGGQEPDYGTISNCKVYDVEKYGNIIVHFVENPSFKENDLVKCKVDENRRNKIVRHHTATHIVTGASRKILGNHIWQAGSKKDEDKAHLDITHYEKLTEEQFKQIQDLSNKIIRKGIQTKKLIMPRKIAEREYGFKIYQGGAVPQENLRILVIGDFNVEACGGLHLDNTKDIEEIYIFNTKRIQDGVIRLEFVAGKDLVEKTKKRIDEEKRKIKEYEKRKKRIIIESKARIAKYKKEKTPEENIIYRDTEDMKELEVIGQKAVKKDPSRYMILIGNGIVFGIRGNKCKKNIKPIVKEIAEIMGGSAGGFKNEFKGGGPLKNKGKEAYEKFKKLN